MGSVGYIYCVSKTDRMWVFAPAEQHVYSIESYQVPHSSGVLCLTSFTAKICGRKKYSEDAREMWYDV